MKALNILLIIIAIVFILSLILFVLAIYADSWGRNHCREVNGNWIYIDGGKHCVDDNFEEIDIYNH